MYRKRLRLMRLIQTAKSKKYEQHNVLTAQFTGYELLLASDVIEEMRAYFPNTRIIKIRKFKSFKSLGHKVYITVENLQEYKAWVKE